MSDKSRGNLLVVIQFVLLAIILFFPGGNLWAVPQWLGWTAMALTFGGLFIAVFGIFGLGQSLTANPVPKERSELKTGGLYARMRHPIYSGLMVMSVGLTISSQSLVSLISCILLFVLFMIKARFEEKLLLATYPAYSAYAARVGRFIPGVGKLPTS